MLGSAISRTVVVMERHGRYGCYGLLACLLCLLWIDVGRNLTLLMDTGETRLPADKIFEGIKVVDKDYLEKKCTNSDWQNKMNQVAKDFQLNAEQEHAFYIVANHSCCSSSDQLRMHIGGMGGTGKSQVLKALIEFFKCKKNLTDLLL
jgi:hypothetical protein